MKDKITQTTNDVKTASKNFQRLVEAISLLVVAVFAVYSAYKHLAPSTWPQVAIFFAALIIALRGSFEFFNHLARKD